MPRDPAYRTRLLDSHLSDLFAEFPAIMVNGPRGSGKTTSARQLSAEIIRLDEPETARAARADPDLVLRLAQRPVLLDEWQEAPEILAAVKRVVDQDPTPGQFLLTGSVRADLTQQMWAGTGRVIRLPMYGLTEREVLGKVMPTQPEFLLRLANAGTAAADGERIDGYFPLPEHLPGLDEYLELALRSGFPEVVYRNRTARGQTLWLSSYIDDLLTRDTVALDRPKDPTRLRRYFEALALNLSGLPTDLSLYEMAGVNARTAASYENLLENLWVLEHLPAWHTNNFKSLVSTKKRYLVDPALATAALGLTVADVMASSNLLGRVFDAFGVAQLRPELAVMYPRPRTFHLRTHGGRQEVDFIAQLAPHRIVGLEFKAGAAPDERDARHLRWLSDQLGADFAAGAVLHSGRRIYPLGERIWALPMCAIWG
jgi:uncharacterized protein